MEGNKRNPAIAHLGWFHCLLFHLASGTPRLSRLALIPLLLGWPSGARLLGSPADDSLRSAADPAEVVVLEAGDLEVRLRLQTNGVGLLGLGDRRTRTPWLGAEPLPLFTMRLRQVTRDREQTIAADTGWRKVSASRDLRRLQLGWATPEDPSLAGISVSATATADPEAGAVRWTLSVQNSSSDWSVSQVDFPQLTLSDPEPGGAVLFPRGPGEVQRDLGSRSYSYRGQYPGGWCAMQFMAAYRETEPATGMYLAVHDPWGSTKNLALESDPARRAIRMRFEHPAPDLGVAGNDFTLEGEAVWRLLRGDWFDAALIYKNWVRRQARWWPPLGADGRPDTPLWMRRLNAWAMTGGAPADCVPGVKAFAEYLGLPVGFHWYNWHQIPFDNDYPHYFPAKEGFAQGVEQLQSVGVFVMPYINGRLWDTLDRGAQDFEFRLRALAAATKQADGKPYLESYGSKETNGEPVRLAAMCPTTSLWQQTVSNIVLRLLREIGTKGVYIDQVAAAAPTLCQDPSHGHPLGGGHWWNEGYWQMLDAIRRHMPPGAMLTTECNGEPFIRWFDGYLTWHWQHDGQVPAFPAVYGGAIQMFGRAYRGGDTKDLALRMKAGQQLVFGEQLGWIDPGIRLEPGNAEFFRQLARLRSKLERYFYAGEMARPPRIAGDIPTLKADWQWSGTWWVTHQAILTGAWQLPREKRLALIFVNVSDVRPDATLHFDAADYQLPAGEFPCTILEADAEPRTNAALPAQIRRALELPPRHAEAWELTW